MDRRTIAINLRALHRLRRHMQTHHPTELAQMIRADPAGELNDLNFRGRHGGELATRNNACDNPKHFPVHAFADGKAVRLVKRAQRGTVGSLWLSAGNILFQALRNQ